jgi:two-component system, NtrC family, sensor histidine kinase KinB
MKTTIRSKSFTIGMVLFLVIILLLSVSSAFYLNRLSGKTSAILKENHYSVVYARDMSENLIMINQEVVDCIITNKKPDKSFIESKKEIFYNSLKLEKNNITEVGEDKLASDIESGFTEYLNSVERILKSPEPVAMTISLQKQFISLYQNLMLLSKINEKAIEEKTDNAKISAKSALIQMSLIGAFCFLIAYGFTFSFSSYFNERFFHLYDEIKEISSGKYTKRISVTGNDELQEIALIFNEMADKLNDNNEKMELALHLNSEKTVISNDIEELKKLLKQVKVIEGQAVEIIAKLENKK